MFTLKTMGCDIVQGYYFSRPLPAEEFESLIRKKIEEDAEAEALEKKAEAMKKYGQAAMMEMIVKALPEMAASIAKPLESIDKVTIIDGGHGASGVDTMGGFVPSVLARTIETMKEVTGLDLVDIMKAETYDAKVNRNVTVSGDPQGAVKTVLDPNDATA